MLDEIEHHDDYRPGDICCPVIYIYVGCYITYTRDTTCGRLLQIVSQIKWPVASVVESPGMHIHIRCV